jgi:hypothetical protein
MYLGGGSSPPSGTAAEEVPRLFFIKQRRKTYLSMSIIDCILLTYLYINVTMFSKGSQGFLSWTLWLMLIIRIYLIFSTYSEGKMQKLTGIFSYLFWIAFLIISLSYHLIAQPSVPNKDMWVTNGYVHTVAVDGDYTYIGGSFNYVGPNTGSGAKLSTESDSVNLNFPRVNGSINKVVPDGAGGWYIGGNFTKVGLYTRNRLARILADGSVDLNWNPGANGRVRTIAVNGSEIFVGGEFTSVGGKTRKYLAKLNNTNGNADENWNPAMRNTEEFINTIAVSGDVIYVGGFFTFIGGQAINNLARLNNTNGNADMNWNPNPLGFNGAHSGTVSTIVICGDYIYVGGSFISIGGQSRYCIARINNINGNADINWNPHATSPTWPWNVSVITVSESHIYVGGFFTSIGGESRKNLARLYSTNGQADNWNPSPNKTINEIAVNGNVIYVGGDFTFIGGQSINYITRLNNTNGNADSGWTKAGGMSGYNFVGVKSMAIYGNDIYTGGNGVTSFGGKIRQSIVKLSNITGDLEEAWNPNISSGAAVKTIIINGNDVYVGGLFTYIGGQSRNRIAKLNNTNGNADEIWNPDANWEVETITINGNDVYVGGLFTYIGGQSRNKIAKLNNFTGSADENWNPNADKYVKIITVKGNDIYVGGDFTMIGGKARNRIAKLNTTNGSADETWNPDANGNVYSIFVVENDIYVGGFFTSVGGQSGRIARLNNTNGSADENWNANSNGAVITMSIAGNDLYAGGAFTEIGGQSRNYLAKLNTINGSADMNWNPNAGYRVNIILVNGEDVYACGEFTAIGGEAQTYFALFTNRILPVELTSFSGEINNNKVNLFWQTSTEINNRGFEVERKTDLSSDWITTGFVKGNGTSSSLMDYSFIDNNPPDGRIKYRLKQFDYNGNFKYSDEVKINMDNVLNYSLSQNYPNPFNPATSIYYSVSEPGLVVIKVFDNLGREVKTLVNKEMERGNYKVEFIASNLSSGVYFYRINAGNFSKTNKMILLH